jgi:hypothetical protein
VKILSILGAGDVLRHLLERGVGDLKSEEDFLAGAFAFDAALVLLPDDGAGEDDEKHGSNGGETERCGKGEDACAARMRRGLSVRRELLQDAGGEAGRRAAGPKGLTHFLVEFRVLRGFELAVGINHGCTP